MLFLKKGSIFFVGVSPYTLSFLLPASGNGYGEGFGKENAILQFAIKFVACSLCNFAAIRI
jgi:hypothetical protein